MENFSDWGIVFLLIHKLIILIVWDEVSYSPWFDVLLYILQCQAILFVIYLNWLKCPSCRHILYSVAVNVGYVNSIALLIVIFPGSL